MSFSIKLICIILGVGFALTGNLFASLARRNLSCEVSQSWLKPFYSRPKSEFTEKGWKFRNRSVVFLFMTAACFGLWLYVR